MISFRDQVIAALLRDEYPLLGATVDALPDGVDASVWHDDHAIIVWLACCDSMVIGVQEAIDALADSLFAARMSPDSPDLHGVVCVPDGSVFEPALMYADEWGISVWMFDGVQFKELDVDEGGEA